MNKSSLIKSINLKKEMIPKQQLKKIITTSPLCNENFYMLVLSVLIACLGLNLPSKTMIIGGMVISPILGSILSLAYGFGTQDSSIARHAACNYFAGFIISVVISALYFVIVPDFAPNQEMFNMTKLSYEDIAVSFAGGIAITLSFFYNQPAMPFVSISIATTLVPPVCIIGYGISQSHPSLLIAACRMFFVNSFFIFLACLILFYIFSREKT